MRVLLLTSDCYGANGGIGLYNRDIVEALSAMPQVTQVVVLARNLPAPPAGVPAKAQIVGAAAGGKLAFIRAAWATVRSQAFDLVLCGHVHLLPVAAPVAALLRVPLALMVYGIEVWQAPGWLTRRLVSRVDAVWSISAITTGRMNVWAGLPESRYALLPNAIHLDRYGVAPPHPDLQARYALQGAPVLLTLARLPEKERYKGVDEVLESMPALLRKLPQLKYLVAGEGDDRPRLMQKAVALGVAQQVVFTGMVSEADKADHFRLADAFVMAGRGEGFGFVFLEALACGVPVVGSQIDGSREALRGGELGELADPADPESVQTCILRALAKPKGVPAGLAYFGWPNFQARLAGAVGALMRTT